ncbi:MAG: coproporphyrinogen-III oxidase family protein [Egibacteraceae bacterium]
MIGSTHSVDLDFARRYIENHVDKRQVNKVQHGFPSPRFWTETEVPAEQILEDREKVRSMGQSSATYLYIGVPYCLKTDPGKCGYCLFPVEDFVGNAELEAYFSYVKREAAMYREGLRGQTLAGVYFGGGTSNLYKAPMYLELMELVHVLFPTVPPEADITLEGIPQLFTRDKIAKIKESGMNRISMGVQQINERLNSLSGRRQTTKHVVHTLEWAREYGLACNVDLIFGWPQQTVSTMVKDLETVISWGVCDITHYELNVGGPTDFALNRYHELPSTLRNLEMYRVACDLLKSHGYEQLTSYNWRKPGDEAGRPFIETATQDFDRTDIMGVGYAAITFFGNVALEDGRAWSFMNWRNLQEYKTAIDQGRFPIERGFCHEREDLQMLLIFRSIFGLRLNRGLYRSAFGVDVYDQFDAVWDALEEWGFVDVTPEEICVKGDGGFYTPLIQTLLAEKRYRELRQRLVDGVKRVQLPVMSAS